MQPYQLEYFLAVAERGSFTRGAQRAGVVQSAVSAAIAQLERELGAPLLERAYHRVTLTAEGQALMPRAREILTAMDAAREAVASARGELFGTVMIGMLANRGPLDLAEPLQAFTVAHPRVSLRLRQTAVSTATALDDVRAGTVDLALLSPAAESPGITFTEIHREPLVFACHRDHPLATAAEVSITDLAGEPFIDYPAGWGIRTVIDLAFAAAGVSRAAHTEITDFDLARSLVRRDFGVTFLPAHAVGDEIAHVPVREALEWTIKLARPRGRRESLAAIKLAEAITSWASARRV
jgi:DNA-binding transcriptional LysR family regulator